MKPIDVIIKTLPPGEHFVDLKQYIRSVPNVDDILEIYRSVFQETLKQECFKLIPLPQYVPPLLPLKYRDHLGPRQDRNVMVGWSPLRD